MKFRVCTAIVLGLLLAAAPQGDPAKADLDKLQGDWQVQSVEVAGKALINVKLEKLTIKGNKLDGLGPEMTVKLAPDQKPKAIDLIRDKDGRPWLGVYSLDGDELILCMAMVEKGNVDEQKRPTDFDKTKVQMIIIAKRIKG